jgi:WD40 repeat protein
LSIGTIICTYTGHTEKRVVAIAWSPDSQYIISASNYHSSVNGEYEYGIVHIDSIVHIWNATDGKQVHSYHIDDIDHLCFGVDLAWISSTPQVTLVKNGAVRIINILSEYELNNFHGGFDFIHDLVRSPDGKFIATLLAYDQCNPYDGYDGYSIGEIEVRDTSTGDIVGQYSLPEDSGPPPFAWSPDSTCIAFVPKSSEEGEISVWRVTSNSEVLSYRGDPSARYLIAWSPDGKFIATGGYKMVRVLNAFTGNEVISYLGHSEGVVAIAWSPDSQYIISASNYHSSVNGEYEYKYEDSIVHIWNASSGENIYTYRSQFGPVGRIVWSPDGKCVAITLGDGKVQIWRAA